MTEQPKIKLLVDSEIQAEETHLLAGDYYNLFQQGAKWARDECERRCLEMCEEVAREFWNRSIDAATCFETEWQQYLKEQENATKD